MKRKFLLFLMRYFLQHPLPRWVLETEPGPDGPVVQVNRAMIYVFY